MNRFDFLPGRGTPKMNLSPAALEHYETHAAARIHEIIQRAYPGHPFEVTVRLMEMRTIVNHPLMPDGYAITVRLMDEDPDGKIYVRLCGELLERFGIPRAGIEANGGDIWIDPVKQAEALSDIK
jgi:hypothetical protein